MPKEDTIGNLLYIRGEGVKDKILQYFSPDPDSDDGVMFDFNKLIHVEDMENQEECTEKWGTTRNSSGMVFHSIGVEHPYNTRDKLYFNSQDIVPKVIERLSQLHPDWEIEYEYSDDWAKSTGCFYYKGGKQTEEKEYEYRSDCAIETFCEIWGRRDNFEWCYTLARYIGEDESAEKRLLPRVEKDYQEYYKREVGQPNTALFANSLKNSFVYRLKNYLLDMPENETLNNELATELLKVKGNIFDELYNFKMGCIGTSADREEMESICDDWCGAHKQAKTESEM